MNDATPSDFRPGRPPTMAAARARAAAVQPDAQTRARNARDGAIGLLPPRIAHGFVTLPEVPADTLVIGGFVAGCHRARPGSAP